MLLQFCNNYTIIFNFALRSLRKETHNFLFLQVSRQRFHNFSGPLIWYVSRCSGKIWVKIKHKKKVIEERLVSKYDVFVIKNVQPDNRYVMKITDASREQNLEFDDVEVSLYETKCYRNSNLFFYIIISIFYFRFLLACVLNCDRF